MTMRRFALKLRPRRAGGCPVLAGLAVAGLAAASGIAMANPVEPGPDDFLAARLRMVSEQIERRGVRDPRVIEAMRRVPRERFVPEAMREHAYEDGPLPIGGGQTISQPYIVAFMTEAARVGPGAKVLEVGTGSGYQAAVLAEMGAKVFSIEILPDLAERARRSLGEAGHGGVQVRIADGYLGWPGEAPFDAILVTAAPADIPPPLLEQLATGGRLVIPVGSGTQDLVRVTRTTGGFHRESLLPVRFVPMTGEAQKPRH
jgi:protein-L-isoaspartate(D-aspartate) O-methyltransferase